MRKSDISLGETASGERVLKLGLPKGSLEQYTLALFARSGWKVNVGSRSYFPTVNDPELAITISRAQEISRYVADGVLDAGITGKDWRLENQSDVEVIKELVYSKTSAAPCRWVLAVRGDGSIKSAGDLEGKKVATELPGVTARWFKEKGVNVKVEFSWGATEAKVASGLADAIVEVTETGGTIKAHGLIILDEVLVTQTELMANKKAMEDPFKKSKVRQIALLLNAALTAESLAGLKMNARERDVGALVAILPSLKAPTVARLHDTDWLSVETVVPVDRVRDLIPALLELGAEGIIEYPLNKVV
ncbi:MAG: ATP phosphoribosyltransferase [Deltaproteobacteria bacterium]|jgi:ATP phosphoribosyltransferase|nr:ATP phosphoribosyltransferase [Deltaproteobacteria bacterium]